MRDPAALAVFRGEAFVPAADSDVAPVPAWVAAIQAASGQTARAPQ